MNRMLCRSACPSRAAELGSTLAWKLAREHGWQSTFDAEYIAVCMLHADAFISIDPAMVARAGRVVPVAELADLISTGAGHRTAPPPGDTQPTR